MVKILKLSQDTNILFGLALTLLVMVHIYVASLALCLLAKTCVLFVVM